MGGGAFYRFLADKPLYRRKVSLAHNRDYSAKPPVFRASLCPLIQHGCIPLFVILRWYGYDLSLQHSRIPSFFGLDPHFPCFIGLTVRFIPLSSSWSFPLPRKLGRNDYALSIPHSRIPSRAVLSRDTLLLHWAVSSLYPALRALTSALPDLLGCRITFIRH